jgi:glutamate 5-kinase
MDWHKRLQSARRIVVKVGTSTVTGSEGAISAERVEPLVRSIAALKSADRQVVLVSSGAVGLGAGKLGLKRTQLGDVSMRQACAAVGQSLLMHEYERLFRPHKVNIAQLLLTEDDFTVWRRYLNLRHTMEKLLKLGVLPIVNENDTVSTAELEYVTTTGKERIFSDNDRLAALVMSKLEADALILLTDVNGLLLRESNENGARLEDAAVIPLVTEITPQLKEMASGPSAGGRGGMLTKLEAARIAMLSGGVAVIANGRYPDTLERIFSGDPIGTIFISNSRMTGKKRWIAYAAGVRGRIVVNTGAKDAIVGGKASLLASGVVRIESQFEPRDVVSIVDIGGQEFARGIANFASREAEEIISQQDKDESKRAKKHILVTRDNIVLLEKKL